MASSMRTLRDVFESRVRTRPHDRALFSVESGWITYTALDSFSNRLAVALRSGGVAPGDRVAVMLSRSAASVSAVLAAWKLGAAYVPIDPRAPAAHRDHVLGDSAVTVVVGDRRSGVEPPEGVPWCDIAEVGDRSSPVNLSSQPLSGDDAAWVLYTSGSTGMPKGVIGPHRASLRRCEWMWRSQPFGTAEVSVQNTALTVVDSVWEVWGSLGKGVPVVLPDDLAAYDPDKLVNLLAQHSVSRICIVPSMLRVLLDGDAPLGSRLPNLRQWVCSGAALDRALVERFYREHPGAVLFNQYGLTETCADVTSFDTRFLDQQMPTRDAGVPIGRPMPHVTAHIVDAQMCPVSEGETGELCLAGEALAAGYTGEAAMTASRFLPNPFSSGGSILFRTGDLVRAQDDGTLVHLGRIDRQVKVRGYRVEPEQIEAALSRDPDVYTAAVTSVSNTADGAELAAYVMAAAGRQPDHVSLRSRLAELLPAHMIPRSFTVLDRFPLTPTGKVDYARLPPPVPTASTVPAGSRSPTERALQELFTEVLELDSVAVDDDFFTVGGNSLLAIKLLSRVKSVCDVDIPMRAFMTEPTVRKLAACMECGDSFSAGLDSAADPYPLPSIQSLIWTHHNLAEAPAMYNVTAAFRLIGDLDVSALQAAMDAMVLLHPALRTSFAGVSGTLTATVQPARGWPLRTYPLDSEVGFAGRIEAENEMVFDLSTAPLVRASLVAVGEAEHILVLCAHHIVCDGRSLGLLLDGIADGYAAARARRRVTAAALDLAGSAKAVEQETWVVDGPTATRAECRPLILPTDHGRPAVMTGRGAALDFVLDAATTARIRRRASQLGVTPFEVTCGAFAMVMSIYSGQEQFEISVPLANRATPQRWDAVGCFMHLARLQVDVSGDPTDAELFHRIRNSLWDNDGQRGAPDAVPPNIMFAYDEAHCDNFSLVGLEVTSMTVGGRYSKVDLTMYLDEAVDHFQGRIEYADAIFDAQRIEAMAGHFRNAVDTLCCDRPKTVSQISLLGRQELDVIEGYGRATETWQPPEICLHELIGSHIAARPDSLVVSDASRWTYQELGDRVESAARALRSLGRQPGDVVGVHMERSFEFLVVVLAVLKAGCAYLPLEPGHPQARLRDYAAEARAALVVTDYATDEWPNGIDVVEYGGLTADSTCIDGPDELPQVAPASPAYVIFTSGSTGRPKGVVVSHNAIVNQLLWMQKTFHLEATDCVLFKTPAGFDVSVWDIFLPFLAGARVEIAAPGGQRDFDYLIDTIVSVGVTTIQFVPSVLQLFIGHPRVGRCRSLERIFVIGEALPPDVATRVRRTLNAELHNLYGPTETTVAVTWWPCHASGLEAERVSIGRMIANCHGHVLDRNLHPVPVGVPGELCVGGIQVADGYIGRPDLTAEKFVADPCAPGATMYRTGDLVRWSNDGQLEFLGRIDRQVKIAGWRIEPGEVESALRQSGLVKQAVVEPDDPQAPTGLIAFVVPCDDAALTVDDLRSVLRRRLPFAAQPSHFEIVPDLPRLPNQKVDRRSLATAAVAYVAARRNGRTERSGAGDLDETRAVVRGAWESVLNCEVGDGDNFLELGGDSVAAIRIVIELNQALESSLTPDSLMRSPIFDHFVRSLPHGTSATSAWHLGDAAATRQQDSAALSALQQRWIELAQKGFGHIPFIVQIEGLLRTDLFEATIHELRLRHAILRSTFTAGSPPVQREALTSKALVSEGEPVLDESSIDPIRAVREAVLRSQRHFDISAEALFDMELVRLGVERFLLVGRLHHIIGDGWTVTLIVEDFERVYAAIADGRDPSSLPAAPQYGHFAAAQNTYLNGAGVQPARSHWQSLFADCDGATSLPSRPIPGSDGARFANVMVSPARTNALRSFAIRRSSTLFSVLVTAFARMLRVATGEDDLVFGTSYAGRHHPGTDRMLGVFVNPLPVRVKLRGTQRFDDAHAEVHHTLLDISRWQDYVMSDLVEHVAPFVGWDVNDTYNVQIVFQNYPAPVTDGPRRYRVLNNQDIDVVRTSEFMVEPGRLLRAFELIVIQRQDGSLSLNFGYQADKFTDAQVQEWVAVFLDELDLACEPRRHEVVSP